MIVKRIHAHAIELELLTGEKAGSRAFIPRIRLHPAPSLTPFEFVRTQFPVNLAFAMTINKAQGQTFGRVGLSLLQPVFSHGQLYVALSRVRSLASLRVKLAAGTRTKNVVYPEALRAQRLRNFATTEPPRPPSPAAIVREENIDQRSDEDDEEIELDPIGFPQLDENDIYDFDDV